MPAQTLLLQERHRESEESLLDACADLEKLARGSESPTVLGLVTPGQAFMSDSKIGIGVLGTAAIARKNIRAIKLARNDLGASLSCVDVHISMLRIETCLPSSWYTDQQHEERLSCECFL